MLRSRAAVLQSGVEIWKASQANLKALNGIHESAWALQTISKSRVRRDAALVVIAAERYRRQHGQFPESAEELVPMFLAEVPIDPYTKKSLRYSVEDGRPKIDSAGLVDDE